jgi:Ni,Fe-hydrogenase III small subunit
MTRTMPVVSVLRGCLALTLVLASAATARPATVILSVPKLQAGSGQEVDVPITVKNARGMSALQMRLVYDPAVLEVVNDPDNPDRSIIKGTVVPDNAAATIRVYREVPGKMPILFLGGADPVQKKIFAIEQEDGTLVTIRFRVIGEAGTTTPLTLEKALAFQTSDVDMLVKTEAGELTVTTPIPWLWILIGAGVVFLLIVIILFAARRKKSQPE